MKKSLLIILLLLAVTAYGQNKTITINNSQFTFKVISEFNDGGDSIERIDVFRGKNKLLTHTIDEQLTDCNSVSIELGSYEITDSAIIFYTYWSRAGDAPASPYGVRKQIYTVKTDGKLLLIKSEIYIETALFSEPYNNFEKNELKSYINELEKKYNARLVFGKNKELLFIEVKTELKAQIENATKHWKSNYSGKLGGYKI